MPPVGGKNPLRIAVVQWVGESSRTLLRALLKSSARRRLTIAVLALLAFGTLPGAAPAPAHAHLSTVPAASGPWLDRFNAWRAGTGVSTLTENAAWSQGDVNHAAYMVKTQTITHSESTSSPYYTVDGDAAARNSNIYISSSTSTSDVQAIDWWMQAPLHSMAMMDPRLTQTGFGSYRDPNYGTWKMAAAVDVLHGNSLATGLYTLPVLFPGNLSTEPLLTYGGYESPDPLQGPCAGYAAPTGLPIYIQIGGNVATTAGPIHTFTGNGTALEHCVLDSNSPNVGSNLTMRGGVVLIPRQPLQTGVTYVVTLTVNNLPYTWSFTTGPISTPCRLGAGGAPAITSTSIASGPISGGTTVALTGCGFGGTSAVQFGGTPAASFTYVSDTQVNAVSPAHATGTVDITVTTPAGTSAVTPAAKFTYAPFFSYFNWFDKASPGMVGDNIHLLNVGTGTASVTVGLPGATPINVTVAPGVEKNVTFPAGTIGGPVQVASDQKVLASQRVQYYSSFSEVWAMTPDQAAIASYVPWFDKATPGMVADNIHVVNPGSATATVTVTLPGATALTRTVPPGAGAYMSFPNGTIGGPVTISSDQPVLGAQRVQYYQTFNEGVARSAAQAQTVSYFNWFDKATPGMIADNIHILNTSSNTATGIVSMPGGANLAFSIPSGQQDYVSWPAGTIGGPVTVSSNNPVLATQRVQYYQSFNEVPQASPSQAAQVSHIMWFDNATYGMYGDKIHVLNSSGGAAIVTVSLPGATDIVFALPAGAEKFIGFPSGTIGGPVTILANQNVLAAQRVQYFQTFNEIAAM